ncbi:MAG: site-2 protease family protein [Patulibacter minatonensis]
MTNGLPPTDPPEPQLRGPLAPRPDGWEPSPRPTLEERDRSVRARLNRIGGPVALVGLLIWKLGRWALILLGKVALLFKIPLLGSVISGGVSIAAYAWLWGWPFAVAIMVTLLIHELGHVVQIKREGMPVKALNFVPFLGAYVLSEAARTPAQQARISIAGPLTGALAASCVYLVAGDHEVLLGIAYTGFFLNLFNLVPLGILDGGGVARVFTAGWWAVIAPALAAVALGSGSTFAAILAIIAAVLIYGHRARGFALDPKDDAIPFESRVNMAVLYVGTAAVCAFGAAAAYVDRTSEIVDVSSAPPVTVSATR